MAEAFQKPHHSGGRGSLGPWQKVHQIKPFTFGLSLPPTGQNQSQQLATNFHRKHGISSRTSNSYICINMYQELPEAGRYYHHDYCRRVFTHVRFRKYWPDFSTSCKMLHYPSSHGGRPLLSQNHQHGIAARNQTMPQ